MVVILERPGQSRPNLEDELDQKYGKDKWQKVHLVSDQVVYKPDIFLICEQAYFFDSIHRKHAWIRLVNDAKDIYDKTPDEIQAGFDYTKQLDYTRYHDICIRRVMLRRGWEFTGDRLIQIRWDQKSTDWYSSNFDPGKVKFPWPHKILSPQLKGWWDEDSIEAFYQSNKAIIPK